MLPAKELWFYRNVSFYLWRLYINFMKPHECSVKVKSEDLLNFNGFLLTLGLKLKLRLRFSFDFQNSSQHGPTYLFSPVSPSFPSETCSKPKCLLSFVSYFVLLLSVIAHFPYIRILPIISKSSLDLLLCEVFLCHGNQKHSLWDYW